MITGNECGHACEELSEHCCFYDRSGAKETRHACLERAQYLMETVMDLYLCNLFGFFRVFILLFAFFVIVCLF